MDDEISAKVMGSAG